MARVAVVGPEIEENLSLRYIASSLARAGHTAEIGAMNGDADFVPALRAIAVAEEPPELVGSPSRSSGGRATSLRWRWHFATVKFDPTQTPSITVSVKGTCNQGPGTLMAHITWTPPLHAGTKPRISISEY